jgi:hypothetical protein
MKSNLRRVNIKEILQDPQKKREHRQKKMMTKAVEEL